MGLPSKGNESLSGPLNTSRSSDSRVPSSASDLDDSASIQAVGFDGTARLTCGGGTILIPRPTADPRDPLNLPQWRKFFITIILTIYAVSGLCLITALSALIVYVMPDYIEAGITQNQISDLFTYPSLFLGIGNIVSMPIAVAVGRRPVILGSTVLLFFSAILCATNKNYHWHLGGRMVAAFAAAQCQALVLLIIQDIFFLHQRARVIQFYSSAEVFFNSGLVIASSYMASALGWRSWYWLFAGISGLAMVLTFAFVPETAYERPVEAYMGTEPTDFSSAGPSDPEQQIRTISTQGPSPITTGDSRKLDYDRFDKRTMASDLRIFANKPTWSRALTCLRQIGQVMLFPHVLWVAINNGLFQGIDVSIQMTYANVLVGPVYHWADTTVSLVQLGQLAVAVLCLPLIGTLSDGHIRYAARRNSGVHEPEQRLIGMVLPVVTALVLTVVYGYAIQSPQNFHWMAIVIVVNGYLFVLLGASTVGVTYLIDSHPHRAGAMLVVIPVTRGLVGFGLSKRTAEYIANIGSVNTFGIYAGVSALVALLGVLLFWKGKAVRHFCASWAV